MKEFLRLLARFSQQSGQNCIPDPLLKNCQEICPEKNPSSIASRTLRWKFLDFCQKFYQCCQNCVWDVRRKTVRIVLDKRCYSCKFRKMSKFFSRIIAKVSSVCQNCCILAAQRKTSLKKFVFWKNSFFIDHFQHFIKNFRTFQQIFSSGLSNVPFQSPDELCLAN